MENAAAVCLVVPISAQLPACDTAAACTPMCRHTWLQDAKDMCEKLRARVYEQFGIV